jgi:outer membrane lipoprotein-sorting protein
MSSSRHSTRRALALLLPGVLLAACAAPPSEVDEIVASNLEARGGAERIRAMQATREIGIITASGGRRARIIRERKRGGLFRLELHQQGTVSVFAHTSEGGWQVAPLQGVFEPTRVPPELDAAGAADQLDIEGPLVDWREKGHTVELAGREMLPGGEAFKLEVTLADGNRRTEFVDVASRLIVRSEGSRIIQGVPATVAATFSDFREVGGQTIPHHIEMRINDHPDTVAIAIESVEIDPELDDARFEFPG